MMKDIEMSRPTTQNHLRRYKKKKEHTSKHKTKHSTRI